jgi:chromosome segregation ATPase
MTARDSGEDKALREAGFGMAWRGYSRGDVQDYVRRAEAELGRLAADRDATADHAETLAARVTKLIAQNNGLRSVIDGICRSPIDPDALQERSRRMIELVREEAAEITRGARATADRADEHRLYLDKESLRRRRDAENDFGVAMAARRETAFREIAELKAAAQAEADEVLRQAEEEAKRLVTEVERQLEAVNEVRARLVGEVKKCQDLLATSLPEPVEPAKKPSPVKKSTPSKANNGRKSAAQKKIAQKKAMSASHVPRQRGGTPVASE